MPVVRLREGESTQNLVRRFRKIVARSGVMGEVRRKRWFTPSSEERRLAKKRAIRRLRRAQRKQRGRRRNYA